MSNVLTRIQNNQITDSTINAQYKLVPGSITGNLLATNVTFNSNITILGNLTVSNSYTQLNSINTYINDPVVVFNNGYTGSLSGYDTGILINRNLSSLGAYGSVNTFFGWVENDQAFEAFATTETGTGVTSINNAGWANVKLGNTTVVSGTITNSLAVGTTLNVTGVSTLGNLIANGPTQINNTLGTTGLVQFTNATDSESTSTGALVVTGGVGVGGNLFVNGNVTTNGNVTINSGNLTIANSAFFVGNTTTGFNAMYAGIPTGYSVLPQLVAQFSENYNGYAQINTQNINTGNKATTDYVATSDTGNDSTFYVDLGIASSIYDNTNPNNSLGTSLFPNDSYLYAQGKNGFGGGNLVVGASLPGTVVKFISGGVNAANVVMTLNNAGTSTSAPTNGAVVITGGIGISGGVQAGGNVVAGSGTASTNTTTGALVVVGGLGVSGAINAGSISGPITGSTGAFTTLQATNFSSGNVFLSGGYATGLANVYATTAQFTNFSSGNILVTGGTLSGITAFNGTTGTIANFASGNILVTGGSANGLTTLSATTAQATNFSSGNILVTGGSANDLTTLSATTAQATNLSTGNAVISGGYISALANATITAGTLTTLVATNLSTGNAVISGGYISALANATVTTAVVTNFSSGNARITGGYSDNHPIGANTAATGAFTTLTASGATTVTNATQSTTSSTGALIVTGGVGIAKNLNVGGDALITGNLTVQGTMTAIQSQTLDVSDLNITVAKGASSAAAANGAGLTVDGSSATLLYTSATDSWNINKQLIGTGALFSNTTASTSTTSGALVVTGGVGIGGALNVAGTLSAGTASFASINNTPIGNATPSTGVFTTLQSTTSTATNFSSGNILVTGGSANGLTTLSATTAQATNFSSGNILVTGGSANGLTTLSATTAVATNFSSGNILVTGGSANGLTTLSATTAQATNFSSGNAVISGGSLNGSPIGALSANTGAFTTLKSSDVALLTGNIVTGTTPSTSITTGAIVIPVDGGIGIGGNINAGVYGNSLHNIQGNVLLGRGTVVASADTILTINLNTATPVPSIATVHVSGDTDKSTTIGLDSFGSSASSVILRRARGTGAAPTAALLGDGLGGIVARGYGATGYYSAGTLTNTSGLRITADENFTDTAQGTFLTLSTVPRGNVEAVAAIKIEHNGNVMIPSYVYSTSPKSGALVVAGGAGIGANLNVGGTSNTIGIAQFESNVVISALTDTTTVDSGSLVLTGSSGLNVGGNAYVGSSLYIGVTAFDIPVTHATIVATDSGTQFAQVAMFNTNSQGSADFAAYANTGSDESGWADMGMTGNEFSDSTYSITKANDGYFIVRPTDGSFGGNLVLATSETGNYNDIVIGVGSFDESSEVARFSGNATTSGYLDLSVGTNATTASNGALRITNNGGLGVTGNVFFGNAVTINSTKTANQDFIIKGATDNTLVWARPSATYDQVLIGNSATTSTLVRGAKLIINSTDSMLLPTGTTAQRPSNSSGTDVTGMFRFNTTLGYIEFYTGTAWQGVTSQFTIITDEQFNGTGSQTVFTLGGVSTTAATIVSINGVMQIPTLAYSVSGTTLTFTEAPASTDIIDVRRLVTTQSITSIASTNGYMGFVADNAGANITTGTASQVVTTSFEPNGAQVSYVANVSVSSANTATTIDTIDNTKYRSAKYIVQITNGSKYQVQEVLVISDGTTAQALTYGVMQTSGNIGVLTATQSGTNTLVQFIGTYSSSRVRIKKDYLAI